MALDARSVLAADGAGCLAAAAAMAASDSLAALVLPSRTARAPVAASLGATAVMLLSTAARTEPTSHGLTRAAAVNLGWVAACCLSIGRSPTRWGTVLIAGTALVDGLAAALQWRLGRSAAAS